MSGGLSYVHGAMSSVTAPAPASPGQSSPDSQDDDEECNLSQSVQWHDNPSPSSQPQRAPAPLQKRRRVTRACDECRRKKIKCDGKQPCTHCTVYSYDCTYDQPSNRRRNPAPQYIEALETRLQRAEAILNSLAPGLDLNDPNLEATILQRRHASKAGGQGGRPPPGSDSDPEAQLSSMIESTGQLDLDEDGQWDFHGGSSGTVFVNRMRQQFGGLLGFEKGAPFLPKLPRPYPGSVAVFDSPKSTADSPFDSGIAVDLPPKDVAQALVEDSLCRACALLRFVHRPSFDRMFERLYSMPAESYGTEENKFLPLLYVVLALGCMFHTDPSDDTKQPANNTYRAGIDQGLKYFRAARSLMDITDCRDLVSLQAILFMIMFLQSTANLSTCYSYIGIALRSSLRMGLHRNLAFKFNPVERETRRRAFWIVRKMDTYVSALLGFPNMLSLDDVDQELPIEVDDEYITEEGILPVPPGKISVYVGSNAHTRLMFILAKVLKYIYPVKGLEKTLQPSSNACYVISHTKIKEIETDLAEWFNQLPTALRPDGSSDPDLVRVQQLLRLAYAHVQMMLYRPFLHYVSQNSVEERVLSNRSFAYAASCVSVSKNIVLITSEMKKRGLLVGAYWFTMYTTFFAVISLVYYVLENPKAPDSQEILAAANAGKDALSGLAQRSQAADRCSTALKGLFEKLPARLKQDTQSSTSQRKKRSAPSPKPLASQFSAPSLARSQKEPTMGIARATTFPMPATSAPAPPNHPSRSSLDGHRFETPTFSNPNLRQGFRDYASPDMSSVGTPESGSTASHGLQQQFQQSQYGMNAAIPDLNAMMFPSADPFAYPNQPMMKFDNVKQENLDMMQGSQGPPMYIQNMAGGQGMYDGIQGQIFGPLPPYLAQGQPIYDIQSQAHMSNGTPLMGMNPQQMPFPPGTTAPNNEMSFDSIFTGGEGDEWGNLLQDQMFRQL